MLTLLTQAFARMSRPVYQLFERAGLVEAIGAHCYFASTEQAFQYLLMHETQS